MFYYFLSELDEKWVTSFFLETEKCIKVGGSFLF